MTTAPTTIRLFATSFQKYWRWTASPKFANVAWIGNHVGVYPKMSDPS